MLISKDGTESSSLKGEHNHVAPQERQRLNRISVGEQKRLTEKLINHHSVHAVVFSLFGFDLTLQFSTWKK